VTKSLMAGALLEPATATSETINLDEPESEQLATIGDRDQQVSAASDPGTSKTEKD